MLQQVFDILWEAAQDAAQRISDFFRRIGEWAKEVSQKVLRAYAGNMAILYGLATEKQIRLMYHRRPRIRKKWYHIILRRIRRFLKTEAVARKNSRIFYSLTGARFMAATAEPGRVECSDGTTEKRRVFTTVLFAYMGSVSAWQQNGRCILWSVESRESERSGSASSAGEPIEHSERR